MRTFRSVFLVKRKKRNRILSCYKHTPLQEPLLVDNNENTIGQGVNEFISNALKAAFQTMMHLRRNYSFQHNLIYTHKYHQQSVMYSASLNFLAVSVKIKSSFIFLQKGRHKTKIATTPVYHCIDKTGKTVVWCTGCCPQPIINSPHMLCVIKTLPTIYTNFRDNIRNTKVVEVHTLIECCHYKTWFSFAQALNHSGC